MKTTRVVLILLATLLLMSSAFVACTPTSVPSVSTDDEKDSLTDPAGTAYETDPPANVTTEAATEPAETEPPVVDVMIGETLDAEYAADFAVSNVFSSDMVVQRNEHIRVWGWADASENGKKVSGEFKGMFAEAIIENGEWVLTFGARLEASAEMGHAMRIYTDKKEIVFENVLVGDVYIVTGQSNCAYSVANHHQFVNTPDKGGRDSLDYDAPIRIHYNSLVQTAGYPRRGTTDVCKEVVSNSVWQRADSYAAIQNFTAIGYLFAHNYVKLTDGKVPVGLIEIDGNGQPLGAFMCNEVADAKGTDRFDSAKGYYVTTGVNADWGRYLYNHYMFPFERYALAGVIWYQGESDFQQNNARVYAENCAALMTYMRSTHNLVNRDFPVFFVEFPTIYERPAGHTGDWHYMDVGIIRAAMGEIPRVLPNSHQIVSTDLWTDDTFFNNLHPNCKFEQAERAAILAAALNGEAGKTVAQGSGPVLVSMELSEDGKKAVLTYENVGDGLKTSDGGTDVRGFRIYRKNCSIHPRAKVTATITAPNQITVESSEKITGLAYNAVTTNVYGVDINLCNSEGVPAGATAILKPAE